MSFKNGLLSGLAATSFVLASSFFTAAEARDQIRIVGSSTVYPFVATAAEEFGKSSSFKTPIVESTGTGGGFKLFCSGTGEATPDITNASRPIKESEKKDCEKNGVKKLTEVMIGYDGIVIANSVSTPKINFTTKHLFLALAKQVPQGGKLVNNPYVNWSDVDASLPAQPIEVYGPPPTSGTRDSFVELVMESACKEFPEFAAAYPKEDDLKKACHMIREDGKFVEGGENDNVLVQKLVSNKGAFAIFGFSFLEENASTIQGNDVDGIAPTYESIADKSYKIARSMHVYAKGEHIGVIPGVKEFLKELVSAKAMGEGGYLSMKGLIVPSEAERAAMEASISAQ